MTVIGLWDQDEIVPDFDAYDMLLLVAERGERWDWSRQLLDTLFKLSAPSTVTMFNAAINAARRGKRWQLAQSLLRTSSRFVRPVRGVSEQGDVGRAAAAHHCELFLCCGRLRKGFALIKEKGNPQAERYDVAAALMEMVDELDLT